MKKRRHSFDDRQLSFELHHEPSRDRDGALSGIEKRVSSAIGHILKRDHRNRYQISAEMSRLLDDDVSKFMLDAYAAEGRELHNISAGRFLALILATGSFDILREFCLEIGADLVIGDEVLTAKLGHIQALKAQLAEQEKALKKLAPTISRFDGGKK